MSLASPKHSVCPSVTPNSIPSRGKSRARFFKVTVAAAPAATVDSASSSPRMVRKSTGCPTLYEVLRVETTASQTEIKAAYRSLAKLYHPDSASPLESGSRDFIEIHEAYAMLSDPASRARYDLSICSMAAPYFRYSTSAAVSSDSGLRFTRSWETDQCW